VGGLGGRGAEGTHEEKDREKDDEIGQDGDDQGKVKLDTLRGVFSEGSLGQRVAELAELAEGAGREHPDSRREKNYEWMSMARKITNERSEVEDDILKWTAPPSVR
jgi:hypothetical protein